MEVINPSKKVSGTALGTIYENYDTKNSLKGLDLSLLGIHQAGIIENWTSEASPIKEDLYSGFGRWK